MTTRSMSRPPPVLIDPPDGSVRRDVSSDDVRRVHPDLPLHGTPEDRRSYLRRCDREAYDTIRLRHPGFTPPRNL